VLAVVCAVAAYHAWDAFLRNQAYGTVVGRVIKVSAPWDGVVGSFSVREGDRVRQGQLLATLDNLSLRQDLAQLEDDLKLAQATLESEVSQLKWESQLNVDHTQKAAAEYYELLGTLMAEESRLADLEQKLYRLARVRERTYSNVVAPEEWQHVRLAVDGQKKKLEKLRLAVKELEERTDQIRARRTDGTDQLRPYVTRIESLQGQIARVRERLQEGEIHSPVDGVVVERRAFAGEYAAEGNVILSVLEDGSTEVVLYMPQDAAVHLAQGDEVEVLIQPRRQAVSCKVVRVGHLFEVPPPHLERYYFTRQKLLPVHLQPRESRIGEDELRVGEVATLPYELSPYLPEPIRRRIQGFPPPSEPASPPTPQTVILGSLTSAPLTRSFDVPVEKVRVEDRPWKP
jgi:multidrug resistance efflux pump